ncbi:MULTISPECIES: nucleotidyltransferase [unclassified Rhizobium]|uniref:nucleotidyltransferase domain-containing protein n=1 Tax=unclassified Rhizobium TaxID=2613769 RepID=UPI0006F8C544|nr:MULTISPECIES: nucleotidyltransferase [unclassified Rhizobium]KQV39328.1 hypothetical protein ASC86_22575 [Rhizobium sp. Root1212]KRD35333.1 hypothetical protein ASE37_21145 [Rhizobium sp. Root268]
MTRTTLDGIDPFLNRIDAILAEIAFSIQLPPSLHGKAVDRYEAVRKHLEATTSIFHDEIEHFYPQGSMAIDATISTRGTDDEYDLDIIAQLGERFRSMQPLEILTELEKGLIGYRGLTVVRQTRCVTIYYADKMHLDITPSLRDKGTLERQSVIMHAKGPEASDDDQDVPMNAYGFCQWYAERTPLELKVLEAFKRRWEDAEQRAVKADADVDEVPVQTEFIVKSNTTLALQLLKRYRNVRYANRPGRMPPSVMLSYFAGLAAKPGSSLTDALLRIANWIIGEIDQATIRNKTLHVENPVYADDVFTDRWPENVEQQERFARDLRELVKGVEKALNGEMLPTALQDWLREVFGDRVVTKAVDNMVKETRRAADQGTQGYTKRGSILVPAAPAVVTSIYASPVKASPHTYFGDRLK